MNSLSSICCFFLILVQAISKSSQAQHQVSEVSPTTKTFTAFKTIGHNLALL